MYKGFFAVFRVFCSYCANCPMAEQLRYFIWKKGFPERSFR